MGIKISYTDTGSNEVLRETILDDVDVEAFEYIAASALDWIDNCFQNRVRQAIDEICEKVEYFLTHENERKEIELAGYQHAMSNHQTIFRFEGMLNIIKEKYF